MKTTACEWLPFLCSRAWGEHAGPWERSWRICGGLRYHEL